jgi:LysR family transcriptional regulator (chromosome initiation inhibitor)
MLDYASLAAVAAVIREGSFERAAQALGVTPSAVSQRVRALEERLGTILIVRAQPCVATTAGQRICAHVERVRLLEDEMIEELPQLGDSGSTMPVTLRIAVNRDSIGTWFVPVVSRFAARSGALVDVILDREEYTPGRLRNGEVLAAVTDNASIVQGCRRISLGALRYRATATPGFCARWFAGGLDAAALRRAPVIVFDPADMLQADWALSVTGEALAAPTHWMPTTQGFLDATLAELGWGMNPVSLADPLIAAGRLIDLSPGQHVDVPLYWQYARIGARLLAVLTEEVLAAAKLALVAPRS